MYNRRVALPGELPGEYHANTPGFWKNDISHIWRCQIFLGVFLSLHNTSVHNSHKQVIIILRWCEVYFLLVSNEAAVAVLISSIQHI